MNSAKAFQYGSGILIETNQGNYELTDTGMKPTTMTGNTLTEVAWDSTIQSMITNAIEVQSQYVSVDFMRGFLTLVDEKMEDFD